MTPIVIKALVTGVLAAANIVASHYIRRIR